MRPAAFLPLLLLAGSAAPVLAAPFQQSLGLEGVTFQVQAVGEGSTQLLQVKAKRGLRPYPLVRQELVGRVSEAQVADLNSDGRPELVVVVQSAGSGSYGSLEAWSAGPRNLEPIILESLSGSLAAGYRGHDQFALSNGALVRRFPIYKANDSNAKATGGMREITYSLQAAPASPLGQPGWRLQPLRSANLPPQ